MRAMGRARWDSCWDVGGARDFSQLLLWDSNQAPRVHGSDDDEIRCATTPLNASSSKASARGAATPRRKRRTAPIAAPRNMVAVAAKRRPGFGWLPPAHFESAAIPVSVRVNTVVLRS